MLVIGQVGLKPQTITNNFNDAFANRQVSLLSEPDPALLILKDPYTYANREGITYPWDVVLYKGKFYLYWGPVPALVISLARLFSIINIGDHLLVFAFVCGVFIFSSLLMLRLRSRFFPDIRWPYVIPGILLAGLANPLPWLLNRPAVYEAAIASGQFFMISGIYFGFLALEKNRLEIWKLILSGTCLGLAVASRASLSYAVLFLAIMIAGYIVWHGNSWQYSLRRLAGFFLPFCIDIGDYGLVQQDPIWRLA